ncbi:hypothetical protein ACFQFC_41010 [Amorphoplanes digitatis]|uniref:SWIM-type domain-containing protein n=1 Tax=Actinoplanes digitatis TaxID=1868 RepID=A0A7W7HXK4_9ACTN|nr:hypothetical protein [Actinoplanes digitatis]MBB4762555.1 hypothetical protein [Actinoplanes digitatis]GID92317.1 hypothetical protein Adi01nite_17290 [Actinoplanes digitatis]
MTDRLSAPFIAMFESLRMAPTFARGRRDARAGHVRHLTISGSLVTAQVRGPDDPTAFRSRIAVRAFGAAEWSRVEDDLAAQARYAADLLAGRMPADIEQVFARAGLTLLPLSLDEVALDCTCERWPMPCAHLAATCYALATSFETDPFGAFAWRGRSRDELLTRLSQLRGATAHAPPPPSRQPPDDDLGDLTTFWGNPPTTHPATAPIPATAGAAAGSVAEAASVGAVGGPGVGGAVARSAAEAGPRAVGTLGWVEVATPPPDVGRADLLLDQFDPPPLRAGGVPLIEALRPAYRALPPQV